MELSDKLCKTCRQFKKRKTFYGHLPTKNIAELKPWDLMHVDLIGPYIKSIRQQQPGGSIILNNASLTRMKINDLATGWFKNFNIPTFDLDEVTADNDEYVYKSSARVT